MIKVYNTDRWKRIYNDKQLDHLYAIWLYTYGGTQDIKTFKEYTVEYEDDPDKYGNCPCYICQSGDY